MTVNELEAKKIVDQALGEVPVEQEVPENKQYHNGALALDKYCQLGVDIAKRGICARYFNEEPTPSEKETLINYFRQQTSIELGQPSDAIATLSGVMQIGRGPRGAYSVYFGGKLFASVSRFTENQNKPIIWHFHCPPAFITKDTGRLISDAVMKVAKERIENKQ